MYQRRGGDKCVGHSQPRNLTSQQAGAVCYPAVDRNLVHASKESSDVGFIMVVGAGEQFCTSDDGVCDPSGSPGQSP
jgi:hypothetical protein